MRLLQIEGIDHLSVMVVLLVTHQQVANTDEDGQQQQESYLQVGRHCLRELLPLAVQLHGPLLMPMPMLSMSSLMMHSLGVRGRLEVGEAGHLTGLLIPMLVLHPSCFPFK